MLPPSFIILAIWITCCSFYISTCSFTLYFYVMELASFLKPHEPTTANFKIFFCSFLTSHSLLELKRVRALLWIRLWLEGMLWLVCSSIQTTKTFSISAIRPFCFLIICVFTGRAFFISFKNFSSAFTIWLTGARGLAFSLSQHLTHLTH